MQRKGSTRVVMIDPRRRKNQVQTPVPVYVEDGNVVGPDRREIGPLTGQPVRPAPVDVAEQFARHAVRRIYDDQILMPVAVQVHDAARVAAVCRQLTPFPTRTVAGTGLVDPGRSAFVVALCVRQDDVDIAVVVDVRAMDGLNDALSVDVEVVPPSSKRPSEKDSKPQWVQACSVVIAPRCCWTLVETTRTTMQGITKSRPTQFVTDSAFSKRNQKSKQSFAASGVGTVMPVNPASMSFPGPYFRKRAFRFRSGLWQLPSS